MGRRLAGARLGRLVAEGRARRSLGTGVLSADWVGRGMAMPGGAHQLAYGQSRLRARQEQIGHHVGVNNDQIRPSRLKASISSGSKLWEPRLSRC